MTKLFIIFLIAHFLVCTILLILRFCKVIKCEYITIYIAYFIPLWGLVMLMFKRQSDREEDRKGEVIEVEKPKADEDKKSVVVDTEREDVVPLAEALIVNDKATRREMMMDVLYNINRSIVVDEDELKEKIVPLEEALVVNDTATRRALIIDVLYSNPSDYISQLYDAKSNGDTEVVHYAATALTEIQKEFDLQFQDIMERKLKDPENKEIDTEYQMVLENYISSGLLTGDALTNQLRRYSKLLEGKLEENEAKGRWTLLNKKANADLKIGDTEALDMDVAMMIDEYPEREGGYMFKLQSAVLKRDYGLIKKIIEEIKDNNIYMSAELRSVVTYWVGRTEEEQVG